MEDQIKGAAKNAFGHLQDAAGGLIGDEALQARGKGNQAAGAVQDKIGQAKDYAVDTYYEVEDVLRDRPLLTLGIGLGLGVLIGCLIRRD